MEMWNIWAASWQIQQSDCAPSEDSEPGQPPSLIRVFAVRMKKVWVLSYPLSAQRRLWSDWVAAQADLSLRWAHMSFCWFCHEAAHFSNYYRSKNSVQLWKQSTITQSTKVWLNFVSLKCQLGNFNWEPGWCNNTVTKLQGTEAY